MSNTVTASGVRLQDDERRDLKGYVTAIPRMQGPATQFILTVQDKSMVLVADDLLAIAAAAGLKERIDAERERRATEFARTLGDLEEDYIIKLAHSMEEARRNRKARP